MSNSRKLDIIVWGASGFTGRLVAEYLFEQYGSNSSVKWAMAGRNKAKLEAVQTELGISNIPIILADSQDKKSLNQMVQQTSVICTTVGPYAKYGSALVSACVEHQTDYCDLAGEVQWIRKMIDQHHETAQANGTKIVHTCGFDSIPSDMGIYFFQKAIKEKTGAFAEQTKLLVKAIKGGMSGGTYLSLSNVLAEAQKDKSIYKVLSNPYGLNPDMNHQGVDEPDLQKVIFDQDTKRWISPFIMAAINTKVVRRSHALADFPYGKKFKYDEAMISGAGVSGRLKGWAGLSAIGLLMMAKPGSLIKKGIDRLLPKAGEGPNKTQRENGFYNMLLIGKMAEGKIIKGKVTGDRDPGYGSTSKMMAESAVCLAKDKAQLPKTFGVLTPSIAMSDALLNRLEENAGLTFSLLEDE